MFISLLKNKLNYTGFQKYQNSLYIYFRGFVIYKDKAYHNSEFYPILKTLALNNNLIKETPFFNGTFQIVLIKNKEITVINDRWGSFPFYYFQNKESFIISTNWQDLIPYSTKQYNEQALLEYLSFGYVLANKTLLKNINEFSPHSINIIKIINQQIILSKTDYWKLEHKFLNVNVKQKEKEFADLWDSQMQIYTDFLRNHSNKCVIPLTGGLDSRLLIATLDKYQIETYAMTWGASNSFHEIINAKEIAKYLKYLSKHKIFQLNQDFLNNILEFDKQKNIIITTGRGFTETYFYTQFTEDIPFTMPGFSGDFLAGSHLKTRMKFWKDKNDIINYIKKFKLSPILTTSNTKEFIENITNSINQSIDEDTDLISSFIRWDLENRQRQFFIRIGSDYKRTSQILPFFDYKYFDFFLDLPFSELLETKLYTNSQLKYLYSHNKKIKDVKRIHSVQKTISNSTINEYLFKIKKKLKITPQQRDTSKKYKYFEETINFDKFFNEIELPLELKKYNIEKDNILTAYKSYIVHLGMFNKQLKEL